MVAVGGSRASGGARRGFGLSLVVLTRLLIEVMRLFTLEKVRLKALRDFIARGREKIAILA